MANMICGECDGDFKVCEHGRRRYAFEISLGNLVLARDHDAKAAGKDSIDISDLDKDLITYFFNAGWSWGKEDSND